MRGLAALLIFAVILGGFAAWLSPDSDRRSDPTALTVANLLGGTAPAHGFARATLPGAIRLPADHGPHPGFRSEWWYFTGNLTDALGREFGFQLTFFRFALSSETVERESGWAANQIYMAHLAVTDRSRGEHRAAERLSRQIFELAGARAAPFAAWLDSWRAQSLGTDFLPLGLRAHDDEQAIGVDLTVRPGKPPVLQGDRGLSRKSDRPGNASYYYSYSRLPAAGTITIDGRPHAVDGLVWMDREWGTSSLGPDLSGWDWFSLQLDDGQDLMVYALRDSEGALQAHSAGALIAVDGAKRQLARDDFELAAVATWQSPATGIAWPIAWRIRLANPELELLVRAAIPDQEQDLTVRYWEGMIDVFDPASGARIGRGYMELTGYSL